MKGAVMAAESAMPLTPDRRRSPYFGVPTDTALLHTPPDSVGSSSRRNTPHAKAAATVDHDHSDAISGKRRSKRIQAKTVLPPTPESLPRPSPIASLSSPLTESTPQTRGCHKRRKLEDGAESPLRCKAKTVVGATEEGIVEPVRKIHLIQERLRYEPWKMLVAVTLLNKTSGRAANPIREEIFRRWPDASALAEASVPDLAEVLYPLGLFNQRANSLIRLSQQYVQLGWPLAPLPRTTEEQQPILPEVLDVKVFYGAGIYASDSFRIYSPLYAGRGGPEKEEQWLEKRRRAIERKRDASWGSETEKGLEPGVEEVGEWMSDVDEEDAGEEEEWRRVVPSDKELRRYLVWRWGLEGITYDIHKGPRIHRERDQRRLGYLLPPVADGTGMVTNDPDM